MPPEQEITAVMPQVGDLIDGKYLVERVLGQGGMGLVVAAKHTKLDQAVAIKVLLPDVLRNAEAVERFAREARAAVKVRGEHVVRVLDVGELVGGSPYMVMELLDGQDLEHRLKHQGTLSPEEVASYVLQACEALAEAHAAGIVHRDLKPANLFLTHRADGSPCIKVFDFGISKLPPKSANQAALTSSSAVMGSPYYMSPEQIRSSHDVDARSDIWSLGVVLYELLSGTTPFRGETITAVIAGIVSSEPPPLESLRSGLPPGLAAVVARCLQKEPGRRFQDVGELAAALAPFASNHTESVADRISHVLNPRPPATVPPATAPASAASATAPATAVDTQKPAPKSGSTLLLLGLLGGAALAGLVAVFWPKHPEVPDKPLPARADSAASASEAPRSSADLPVVLLASASASASAVAHPVASAEKPAASATGTNQPARPPSRPGTTGPTTAVTAATATATTTTATATPPPTTPPPVPPATTAGKNPLNVQIK